MASSNALRYAPSAGKSLLGSIYIQCRVRPSASKKREGVIALSDTNIEICTSAHAVEGQANKAVIQIISNVLKVPKTDIEIKRGLRSRDKTVVINSIDAKGDEIKCINMFRMQLMEALK